MGRQFEKLRRNPVFGGRETGTCFDAYVSKDGERYRMDFSWRKKKSLAVTFSDDGINWDEPQVTLGPDEASGWEENVNRNCVLKIDGVYRMWYTGQARGYSFIGFAESADGIRFTRIDNEPVLIPERAWEGFSVMNPCVLYTDGVYKMWYAAGETYEPNVLAYAESADGVHWKKASINPIFVADPDKAYEKDRVGGCQVLKTDDMGYLMFYIGYEDIHTARICAAKSSDGKTRWQRSPMNPLIVPVSGEWDEDACYKPTALWNEEEGKWMVWYNGRKRDEEYIGLAELRQRDLF